MQVPDKYWEKFKNHELPMRHRDKKENMPHARAALAMCENIDWNVGRLLAKLDELDVAEDTIVCFFHDNGPNGSRWNGDMKGRKGSTDEGGVRSPLLVRWPNGISGGKRVTQIAAAIDLLPTLADLTGVNVQSEKPLDGVSLKPLLTQENADWPERTIVSVWKQRLSLRTQQYRLDYRGELYDIAKDPGQRNPISDQPELVTKLKREAEAWRNELKPLDRNHNDTRPFMIGHPDYQCTQIPARDGTAHGNIKRSNRYPNCSFFNNWKTTDDKITWEAEVPADGTFEVELYYTCPVADVGSTIELSYNDAKLSAKIAEAHDPTLVGAEQDRSPRTESYVKDFKPLKICLLYTSPSPRDQRGSRMPSSA